MLESVPETRVVARAPEGASLYVIVPGFGAPCAERKTEVLRENLGTLRRGLWSRFEVHVCCYDMELRLPPEGLDDPAVTWHRSRGVVADFLRTVATPSAVAGFDYVMVLLDDVLLDRESFDAAAMLRYQRMFGLDLVSPTLHPASPAGSPYPYMHSDPDAGYDLKITTCCELFCYLMPTSAYATRYYPHLDAANPWNWGTDLLLTVRFGLRIGMLNHVRIHHLFSGRGASPPPNSGLPDPWAGYAHTLARHGFPDGNRRLAELPATLCVVRELATLPSDI